MKTPVLPLLIVFLFQHTVVLAQSKRIAHWYFGYEAGIDFSSGTAVNDVSGKLVSIEGSAVMSDPAGNLLFYTNGEQVWNRNHTIMPNGSGLRGDQSSVQAALIVPVPGSNTLYYLFTTFGSWSAPGLYYNIIDMNLNGGLGDITATKNVQLFGSGTELLAGTIHCNGVDFWIVSRQVKADALRFYAYKLTKNGLSNPVITEFQTPGAGLQTVGTLTFSQDGSLLAACSPDTYLFNFNTQTGVLTMKNKISRLTNENLYSNALSPDGSKLYTTSWVIGGFSYLSQFDLTAANIAGSRTNLDSVDYRGGSPNGFGFIGQIRLAPDQKIYVSRWYQRWPIVINPNTMYALDSIDVIHTPNALGMNCQLQRNYLYLDHKPTMLGLPTFISNYTSPVVPVYNCSPPDFTVSGECSSQDIKVSFNEFDGLDAFKWNFGDPPSGAANESTNATDIHHYTQAGKYVISLILFHGSTSDTVKKTVKTGMVAVHLGNDTVICGNTSYTLRASGVGISSYLWQNGTTAATLPVTQNGLYWVEVSNSVSGCSKRDSINISFEPYPAADLGLDQVACEGQSRTLQSTAIQNATYNWNNGAAGNSITVSQTGDYWLSVTLNGCTSHDTVKVTFYPYPKVDLGNDTVLCKGQTMTLTVLNPAAQIRWHDGSVAPTYLVNKARLYFCTVTENGCATRDSIQVTYDDKPAISFPAYTICDGQYVELMPVITNTQNVNLLWPDGSGSPSYKINAPGVYALVAGNRCGVDVDSAIVKKGHCELYMPTAFTPNGDGRNDVFRPVYGDQVVKFKMVIYNRWGQKIFETTDLKRGWNGFLNGNLQPQGTYVWTIQYDSYKWANQFLKGTVVLIH